MKLLKTLLLSLIMGCSVIFANAQSITVTQPNGTEQMYGCQTYLIKWTSSGVSNYYNIDYKLRHFDNTHFDYDKLHFDDNIDFDKTHFDCNNLYYNMMCRNIFRDIHNNYDMTFLLLFVNKKNSILGDTSQFIF